MNLEIELRWWRWMRIEEREGGGWLWLLEGEREWLLEHQLQLATRPSCYCVSKHG
jgi:hypothetical protein